MGKELEEMTLEELWQLFPIVLENPNPLWDSWYASEKHGLQAFLENEISMRISHIGSTAIRDIAAKPIVDILLEVSKEDFPRVIAKLKTSGWTCMQESPERVSFNKGYTLQGFAEKVFHLHVRHFGDCGELYFRDYLNEHSPVAKEYESLKKSLWKKYEHNRDGYTEAKTPFITHYTQIAKQSYRDRYSLK